MLNLQLVVHTLVLVVLISIANFSLVVALLLKPFSPKWAWSWSSRTAEWFWSYMQRHWYDTLNAKGALTITGDEIPKDESAVIISNHLAYGDYYLVQALALQAGMLGKCRYFVKKQIVWQIPFFGWAFWAIGMILVSRNWTSDVQQIQAAFRDIKDNKHDVWVVLYPDGTRRTPKKLLKAQAFERQNGKPELKRVLYPRTKGFASTIQGLRDSHVRYLYDLTFLYTSPGGKQERVPSLAEQLSSPNLAREGYRYRIHVRRIAIADLPRDDEGLRRWCEEAWMEKDEQLNRMVQLDAKERKEQARLTDRTVKAKKKPLILDANHIVS